MTTLRSSDQADVIVIPKFQKPEGTKIKAAVYCRVSTKSEGQEDSLENQIDHYKDVVGKDPRYELTKIYYDFGISGFKENRPGFQKMMADSRKGKFELLITKSITRFARNTGTVLKATRELKDHGIGVYFELQRINTLGEGGELLMTLYAAFGQAESEANRVSTQMTIRRKKEKRIPTAQLSRVFGYCRNDAGEIVPDANAKWVMEIFEMAADGFTVGQITNYLNKEGVKTQNGAIFYRRTVQRILSNEEYKGDFVQQKHYVDEHRKERLNTGQLDKIYYKENHLPIVTNELWADAQKALNVRKRKKPDKEKQTDLNNENYPYRHKLFCAKCGYPLQRVYMGGKYKWACQGKLRFTNKFCPSISVPDEEVRTWGEIDENTYVAAKIDRGRVVGFDHESENEWKKHHTKKRHHSNAPALTIENYPYKDRIFCKYCGSRLRRIIANNGRVWWICDNFSRNGKTACKGIRVPDDKLQSLRHDPQIVYIGKEIINGKEYYGYSSKPDTKK